MQTWSSRSVVLRLHDFQNIISILLVHPHHLHQHPHPHLTPHNHSHLWLKQFSSSLPMAHCFCWAGAPLWAFSSFAWRLHSTASFNISSTSFALNCFFVDLQHEHILFSGLRVNLRSESMAVRWLNPPSTIELDGPVQTTSSTRRHTLGNSPCGTSQSVAKAPVKLCILSSNTSLPSLGLSTLFRAEVSTLTRISRDFEVAPPCSLALNFFHCLRPKTSHQFNRYKRITSDYEQHG